MADSSFDVVSKYDKQEVANAVNNAAKEIANPNVQPVRMDAALDEITMPTEIVAAIAAIPDVVEHGLFLNGIDTIVIARGDTMEVRRRGQARSR